MDPTREAKRRKVLAILTQLADVLLEEPAAVADDITHKQVPNELRRAFVAACREGKVEGAAMPKGTRKWTCPRSSYEAWRTARKPRGGSAPVTHQATSLDDAFGAVNLGGKRRAG